MIKFFRRIRQKMLTENKFNKYLLYAVGEIVLVVIGILIALSINTWNEANKNSKWEKRFLNDLRNELKSDYNQLSSVHNVQKTKGLACEYLLELITLQSADRKDEIDSIL